MINPKDNENRLSKLEQTITSENQSKVGMFELTTLIAIHTLKDNAYGTKIWEQMEKIEERRLANGAIYTTLKRLKNKDIISGKESEPLKQKGGKRRTYYELTQIGEKILTEAARKMSYFK